MAVTCAAAGATRRFNSYALALWYGAQRVADGAYSGGQVLSVLVASLLGSFSLGLVSLPG
jgi:ATP-binding cassette subfamily B (MDR/TAP) protein 1